MKRMIMMLVALFAFAAMPAHAQRLDLKNTVDVVQGLVPMVRANTAATGPWVDLAQYAGAMCSAASGVNDQASQYIVLQDSVVGSAVAAIDSANVGPDSTTTSIAYRGRGRYIRMLLRASGNAADTGYVGALCILSGKRAR